MPIMVLDNKCQNLSQFKRCFKDNRDLRRLSNRYLMRIMSPYSSVSWPQQMLLVIPDHVNKRMQRRIEKKKKKLIDPENSINTSACYFMAG